MSKRISVILAAVAMALTVFAVWYANRPITPRKATWDDVLAEAKAGKYRIITTEELADRYRKCPSSQLLVDTRQEWEYRRGHIQGALNFPMEPTWWARWSKADDLKNFLGPDPERSIVFY